MSSRAHRWLWILQVLELLAARATRTLTRELHLKALVYLNGLILL